MLNAEFFQIADKFKSWKALPGWLKQRLSIGKQIYFMRQALGMTQKQLAEKIHSKAPSLVRIEQAAVDPRISTLQRIAENLNCELLVRLVPKENLEKFVTQQANNRAQEIIRQSVGTANIEIQKPSKKSVRNEIKNLTDTLLKKRSKIWDS